MSVGCRRCWSSLVTCLEASWQQTVRAGYEDCIKAPACRPITKLSFPLPRSSSYTKMSTTFTTTNTGSAPATMDHMSRRPPAPTQAYTKEQMAALPNDPSKPKAPFLKDLREKGYAVVPNLVPKERCDEYVNSALTWLEDFGLGFKRDDKKTWHADKLPVHVVGGLYNRYCTYWDGCFRCLELIPGKLVLMRTGCGRSEGAPCSFSCHSVSPSTVSGPAADTPRLASLKWSRPLLNSGAPTNYSSRSTPSTSPSLTDLTEGRMSHGSIPGRELAMQFNTLILSLPNPRRALRGDSNSD